MENIKLVIFDFDGTIVDTAPDLVRTTNRFLQRRGFEPLADHVIRAEIGFGLNNLLYETFPELALDAEQRHKMEAEFLQIYKEEYLKEPRLFDGIREFLKSWPHATAIVSNKRERLIHPILQRVELDQHPWKAIIGGDTFPVMKPHPRPFEAAMQAAGVTPAETLMVGDGIPDMDGAQAVGMQAVAVTFGYSPLELLLSHGAHYSIGNYFDLMRLLRI